MPKQVAIGPLSLKPNSNGKHYVQPKITWDEVPQRVTNSSIRALYVTPKPPMRAGSQDFLRCESRGMG